MTTIFHTNERLGSRPEPSPFPSRSPSLTSSFICSTSRCSRADGLAQVIRHAVVRRQTHARLLALAHGVEERPRGRLVVPTAQAREWRRTISKRHLPVHPYLVAKSRRINPAILLQPNGRVEKLEALLSRAISTLRAHMSSTLAFATSRAPVARVAYREAEPRCATVSAADRARAMPTRATTSAAGIPSAESGFAGPRTLKAPTRRDRAVAGSISPGAGGDVIGDVSDASRARSRLVLYTKPGCCLCEGLEEKLGEIFRGR